MNEPTYTCNSREEGGQNPAEWLRQKNRALVKKVRKIGDKVDGAACQKQKEERASRKK